MAALEERRTRTGETTADVIISALADALEVEHSTLFQVSNSTALTQGVFDGAVDDPRTQGAWRFRPGHL